MTTGLRSRKGRAITSTPAGTHPLAGTVIAFFSVVIDPSSSIVVVGGRVTVPFWLHRKS